MEKKKIVLIEDDEVMARAIAGELRDAGFEIQIAHDGEVGLAMVLETHPDLTLLDVLLPKMDGITLLQELHKDAWGKGAKVIILTNLSSNKDVAKAIEGGSYAYLVKDDWTLEDIVHKVRAELPQ